MNSNYKLLIGIAIGLVAALILGTIAFQAGKTSVNVPAPESNNNSSTTINPPINSESEVNTNKSSTDSLPNGQIKVVGSFGEYSNGLAPGVLRFALSEPSGNLTKNTSFNFTNQTLAHNLLKTSQAGTLGSNGCEFINGKAEIIIADFKPQDTTMSESTETAKLVSVIKILSPAHCSSTPNN